MRIVTLIILPLLGGLLTWVLVTVAAATLLAVSGTPPNRQGATPGLAGALVGIAVGMGIRQRVIRGNSTGQRQEHPIDISAAALLQEVDALWALGEETAAERDEWKARALEAEGRLGALGRSHFEPTDADHARFAAVKRAFAQKYHPDRGTFDGIERAVREEVFREFWPEIERIEFGQLGRRANE